MKTEDEIFRQFFRHRSVQRAEHPDYKHIDWLDSVQIARGDALGAIPRYQAIENMTHRTSVGLHSIRVMNNTLLFSSMMLLLGKELDQPKAVFLADHHDDPELITGDIPAPTKWNATPEQKDRMKEEERRAVHEVSPLVDLPMWAQSYPDLYEEYERKDTLEARLVNYVDKWDGLHEAINEVICGENPDAFKQVIRDYEPEFEALNVQSKDWQPYVETCFGQTFFEFPNPDRLIPRKPTQLNWARFSSFISSLVGNGPISYRFWLYANQQAFKDDFFRLTLPGWLADVPQEVKEDIVRIKMKDEYKTRLSGIIVPASEIDFWNPTFGEGLLLETLSLLVEGRAAKIRMEKGLEPARGKYYDPTNSLADSEYLTS